MAHCSQNIVSTHNFTTGRPLLISQVQWETCATPSFTRHLPLTGLLKNLTLVEDRLGMLLSGVMDVRHLSFVFFREMQSGIQGWRELRELEFYVDRAKSETIRHDNVIARL